MDEVKVLQTVRNKLREHLNDYADSLAQGNAKDFADYRYITGVIYGLALAEREVLDLKSALEHDDE